MFANTHAVKRKTLVVTLYWKIQPLPWVNSQIPEPNYSLSSSHSKENKSVEREKNEQTKYQKQNLLRADAWSCFMSMIFSYYSIYYYKPNVYATTTTELQRKSKACPHSLWAITSRPASTVAIPWASLSRVLKGEFRHVNESAHTKSSGGMQVGPNVPLLMKTAAKESS